MLQPDSSAAPKPAVDLPFGVRVVAPIDRRHFTVANSPDWDNPPSTCPVETAEDESAAQKLGAAGIDPLPTALRQRIAVLWDTAEAFATQLDVGIEAVKDPLLNLFQARGVLITDDDTLTLARRSVQEILATAAEGALQRGYHDLNPFFLNEALFARPHLFPFTD